MALTLTGASGTSTLDSSLGLSVATWTTGTRPSAPVTGQLGYNTTTGQIEVYNATYTTWSNAGSSPIYTASYLVVAGGGGGGSGSGGGGAGAGGFLTGTTTLVIGTTYTTTVGAGGSGASGAAGTATSGSNSVISGNNLTTITSIGGGRGGNEANSGSGGPATRGFWRWSFLWSFWCCRHKWSR